MRPIYPKEYMNAIMTAEPYMIHEGYGLEMKHYLRSDTPKAIADAYNKAMNILHEIDEESYEEMNIPVAFID